MHILIFMQILYSKSDDGSSLSLIFYDGDFLYGDEEKLFLFYGIDFLQSKMI